MYTVYALLAENHIEKTLISKAEYVNGNGFCILWYFIEAAWPNGQHVGLTIQQSRVPVMLWPLPGFASW